MTAAKPRPVLRERLSQELTVTAEGQEVTLRDLRELVTAADAVGLSNFAEFGSAVHDGQLKLTLTASQISAGTVPDQRPTVLAEVTVTLPADPSPVKTAEEIADALKRHGREPECPGGC